MLLKILGGCQFKTSTHAVAVESENHAIASIQFREEETLHVLFSILFLLITWPHFS